VIRTLSRLGRPFHGRGKVAFPFLLLAALCGGACAPAHKSPRARAPAGAQEPTVTLLSTERDFGGAETCFNALDDNQNHLIDEGCGVPQSEVQFAVAWSDEGADVDLHVTDPKGHLAAADGTTTLGLTLSADCPAQKKDCEGQNFETVYLEEPDPAPGTYRVRVRLEVMPTDADEIVATFGARLPNGTSARRLVFFAEGQEIFLVFQVPRLKAEKKPLAKENVPREESD
jgi:hypothetical protein